MGNTQGVNMVRMPPPKARRKMIKRDFSLSFFSLSDLVSATAVTAAVSVFSSVVATVSATVVSATATAVWHLSR